MFTGIIEKTGILIQIDSENENRTFTIESDFSHALKIDQSVSHNGVCLTVIEQSENWHKVTAIKQTLLLSNLSSMKIGSIVNLERCLPANGRIDGHLVQGHIDTTAICKHITNDNGSWRFVFEIINIENNMLVNKGSVCVNGVSLTISNTFENTFEVCIIPYTFEHTNFNLLQIGDIVNIEFDILGKYFVKWMQMSGVKQQIND